MTDPGAKMGLPPLPQWNPLADGVAMYTREDMRAYALAAVAQRDEEIGRLRAVLREARTSIIAQRNPMFPADAELIVRIDTVLPSKEQA